MAVNIYKKAANMQIVIIVKCVSNENLHNVFWQKNEYTKLKIGHDNLV